MATLPLHGWDFALPDGSGSPVGGSGYLSLLRRQSIVPPLRYSYVQIGAGLRYMLHEVYGVAARFGYRFGLGVGDDAKRIWGTKTNEIGGFTVAGDLVFDLSVLKEGIFATVGVEFFRFTTRFRGQTACRVLECADYELWEPWPQEGDDEGSISGDTVQFVLYRLKNARRGVYECNRKSGSHHCIAVSIVERQPRRKSCVGACKSKQRR